MKTSFSQSISDFHICVPVWYLECLNIMKFPLLSLTPADSQGAHCMPIAWSFHMADILLKRETKPNQGLHLPLPNTHGAPHIANTAKHAEQNIIFTLSIHARNRTSQLTSRAVVHLADPAAVLASEGPFHLRSIAA